ncbi:MAG: DUF4838 domain-containing protein [Clostridia bacterium]|nr:DUF4838 domain-containing protein [Clostridia bacterium]
MLKIKMKRFDHVVVFAAEELKKYLRMMMPATPEIEILFDPAAEDGFRLGLLEDFGLSTDEVEDAVLDDVVHIDTTEEGGILAGSNTRSILFAVYRFLRLNGCRWLYPGVDGEHVPMKDIVPVTYHKKADNRFRGHCNEGAESQTCMLETIDFYAKQEINVYMIEFDNPFTYYNAYYTHRHNDKNRPPEPVTYDQVKQWKRQCEVEIAKRGLQFHDMGHGWTAEPYGLDSTEGWKAADVALTEKQKSYLAELDGVRGLYRGVALNTNLCMSNPEVRSIMADSIVDYAEKHANVTYLHVWLADGSRNHCECAECVKARPSDYYLMIMNELDEKLTAKGLKTRIVFIAYYDTLFPPEQVKINNPRRFSLLYAPITRSYCSSITADSVVPEIPAYKRNDWESPKSSEENLAFLKAWQKDWNGPCFSYEYHFWRHQYKDPTGLYIAKRIYEDIQGLKYMGLDGFVEDGSQRSFFPTGFAIYVYAETLINTSVTFQELVEDYFSHIYGKDWKQAYSVLERVSAAFDFAFMSGEATKDERVSKYFDPAKEADFDRVRDLASEIRTLVEKHMAMPTRPQTVSWRLLAYAADFFEGIAGFMKERCKGFQDLPVKMAKDFLVEFGKNEIAIERYYDQANAGKSLLIAVNKPKKIVLQAGTES